MNRQILDMLEKRMSDDYRRRDYENDNRDSRDNNDMRDNRDSRDYNDGRNNFYYRDGRDNRDGVYDGRSSDYRRDGEDGRRDRRDYGNHVRLSKSDMHKWKTSMENSDGTMGPHYDMSQIMQVADKLGIKFKGYDEKEFCIAVNMMYSDYCRTIKKYVSPDKELHMCAELAADFLEDADAPEPSEKLALYYHCIVCSE